MRTRRRPNEFAEGFVSEPDNCREDALKILERTLRTRLELEQKLKDKGHVASVIAPVLDRLTEVGLVDDAEYARAWLSGRWGRKPSGWRRLQQELSSKGISEDDIEKARELLTERGSAPDEAESAAKLIAQARRRYAKLEPNVQRQRLYGLLARRGYDADTIRRALAIETPLESGVEA
jgi:regulatory protein